MFDAGMKGDLDGIPIIDCSNVGRYYYQETDQEHWDMVDFPNIAPPFESFWLDFSAPQFVNSEEFGTRLWDKRISHWGFLCVGTKLGSPENRDGFMHMWSGHRMWEETYREYIPLATWGLDMWLHYRFDGLNFGPIWHWRTLIDERGQMLRMPDGKYVVSGLVVDRNYQHAIDNLAMKMGPDEAQTSAYNTVTPYLHTAMLSISFMHCRNVALQDVKPPLKTVHNKAQKRRGEKPYQPLPYKVLAIQPMKQIIKQTERQHGVGTAKAMHIVRGNFADYSEGRGLFGKLHGTFWRPQHVRGGSERGVTTKDYSIKL